MKSQKIKLYNLTYTDKLKLETLSNEHRKLYNFLLENAKNNCNFKELTNISKNFRNQNRLTISAKSAQNTCRSLINNVKSFYSLRKKSPNKNPKFPYKFKSWKYFTTFTYDWNNGNGSFEIKDNVLEIQKRLLKIKLPDVCKNIINENIKIVTFKKENDGSYFVIFVYSEKKSNFNLNRDNFLSLDLGVSKIFAAFNSQGEHFGVLNQKFKKLEKQKDKLRSMLDQKQKYSKRWKKLNKRFVRLSKKVANKNKDFQHKVSKKVIDYCRQNDIGTLLVGDIKTSKLIKKKNDGKKCKDKQNKGKNRSTQNRGTLSRFKTFLDYKSKKVGMDYQKVNEAFTSQMNCLTGKIEFDSDLGNREVEISSGLIIDRDFNSAINIAKKVKGEWFAQFEDWKSEFSNFQEMYIDCSSNLVSI